MQTSSWTGSTTWTQPTDPISGSFNELNFARFDAKLEQRVAELRAELLTRLAELEARMEKSVAALKSDLLRWMVGMWITLLGAMIAV